MPRSKSPGPGKPRKKPIENYEHKDKQRANNPPVGLVTPETDRDGGKKLYAYDPHLDPQLVWAGKAEHTSFEIPTVSLDLDKAQIRWSGFEIDRANGTSSARTAMR